MRGIKINLVLWQYLLALVPAVENAFALINIVVVSDETISSFTSGFTAHSVHAVSVSEIDGSGQTCSLEMYSTDAAQYK